MLLTLPRSAPADQPARFERLLADYGPALRRLVVAYLVRPQDREDLFQEIALALWQALPSFRGEASERTWLYRIAHNVAITAAARLRKRHARELETDPASDPSSAAAHPEADLLQQEKQRLLLSSIALLPDLDKQLVLLHLEGLSYAEIEAVVGLSPGAIATRLTRIREKLSAAVRRSS